MVKAGRYRKHGFRRAVERFQYSKRAAAATLPRPIKKALFQATRQRFEQPDLVKHVPDRGRRVGLDDL